MTHIWPQDVRKVTINLYQLNYPLPQPHEIGTILQMRKLKVKEPV